MVVGEPVISSSDSGGGRGKHLIYILTDHQHCLAWKWNTLRSRSHQLPSLLINLGVLGVNTVVTLASLQPALVRAAQ